MKRIFPLVLLFSLGAGSLFLGCGDEFDGDSGSLGGNLTIPRALLEMNISKIQMIALESGSGRSTSRLLTTCQKSNLGKEFEKGDMVRIIDGSKKRLAFVKDVTRAELEAGASLKVELETGTNYLFIFEIIGTGENGAYQLLANGSSVYEKVSKGSDNKSISVTLTPFSESLDCDPLFND